MTIFFFLGPPVAVECHPFIKLVIKIVILPPQGRLSVPKENFSHARVYSSIGRRTTMSEPISEPVSPITELGDHFSMECEESELNAQEDVSIRSKSNDPQKPPDNSISKYEETSITVQPINDEQELDMEPTDPLQPPYQHERRLISIYEQLGMWDLVMTAFGSLYALLVLGFLWFLWGGHDNIPFWKWLVLNNYVQKTVTLSLAFLRTIIGAQSSLATSMLAAIIMETLGFTLKQSAFLSIQRSSGGQPLKLLEVRYFLDHSKVVFSLTVLLSFTTTAAYLTSTALISDFKVIPTPAYPVDMQILCSLSNRSLLGDEPVYSNYRPANFPIFAEYSEPAVGNSDEQEIDDTGPTLRALLPIPSPSIRENLNNYTGYATLLNNHVVCVKPLIQNLTFESRKEDGLALIKPLISGQISLGKVPSGIMFDPDAFDFIAPSPILNSTRGPTQSITFICEMAPHQLVADEWPISMCVAGNMLNYTRYNVDSGRLNILGTRATSLLNETILFDSLSYVMVNYSGVPPQLHTNLTSFRIEGNNWTEIEGDWPTWRTFEAPSTYPDFKTVSISYCFSHFASIDAPISANSSTPNMEPTLSKSNTSSILDSDQVVSQLGADGASRSLNDRGILSLQKADSWATYTGTMTTTALDGTYGFGMQANHFTPLLYGPLNIGYYQEDYEGSPVSATWGLCTNCMTSWTDDNAFGIHMALSSIFQTSIRTSGSVATALQALFTVVNMMQYYDR
jgi:hypothetical protein